MKRLLIAMMALGLGGGVSAALLVYANPARSAVEVYVASRDLPAGADLGPDAMRLDSMNVSRSRALLFVRGDESQLMGLRSSHDLLSGQLIQRSDVMGSNLFADRRLVLIPVKDSPSAQAGSKVDLLVVGGTPDHPTVVPFAIGIEVRASVQGGLVVVVASKEAAAFVYAANTMHLVAVIAEPGTADGTESAVSTPDQAMAIAAQR